MSSVDWKKLKGPEIDAMIHHAVRHDGKDVRYRNSYIDKEKTHLNYVIGPQMGRRFDGTKGLDEAQRLKRGLLAYSLFETYGLPLDIIEDEVRVDKAGFQLLSEMQREKNRRSYKCKDAVYGSN